MTISETCDNTCDEHVSTRAGKVDFGLSVNVFSISEAALGAFAVEF